MNVSSAEDWVIGAVAAQSQEVAELKGQIKRYEEGEIVKQTPNRNAKRNEIENLKISLKNITNERIAIKKDVVDIEAAQRDLLFKSYKKERNLERVHVLCVEGEEREKAAIKTQKCLTVTKTKKKKLETRVMDTEQKLKSNTQSFDRVKEEMTSLAASSRDLEDDVTNYQSHLRAELECAELRRQCRYFTKHTQAQDKDAQATERLLIKVLSAYKSQFFLLKGAGLATPDVDKEYSDIVDMVTGGREVSWADQSVMESDHLNMSAMHTVNDETVLISTNFNTPSASTLTSILKKRSRNSNSTPVHCDTTQTPAQTVTISNGSSPEFQQSRVSLIKKFDETTPKKSLRANETFTMENDPCNATFDLGSHAKFRFSNTTPLRDSNRTPTSKVAWMEPPKRATPSVVSGTSGELSISSYLPEVNTPKRVLPAELLTPLRDLSVNKRKTDMRPIQFDTPNKQAKFADKPSKHVGKPTAMVPLRASESKENICPKTKPLRKATSTQNLTKNDRIQRHVNGLKRAVSSSVIGGSRKFDPRSAKDKVKSEKPRWH